MLAMRLIQLVERHADSLARDMVQDLAANEHTPTIGRIAKAELEPRVFRLYHDLGNWLGDPNSDAIRVEYEEWGRIRFRQGIPFSEIVYALILTERHLRRYVREHGFVIFSGDKLSASELAPLELYSIQQLNYAVGDFFDEALYYLTRGYESQLGNELSNHEAQCESYLTAQPRN